MKPGPGETWAGERRTTIWGYTVVHQRQDQRCSTFLSPAASRLGTAGQGLPPRLPTQCSSERCFGSGGVRPTSSRTPERATVSHRVQRAEAEGVASRLPFTTSSRLRLLPRRGRWNRCRQQSPSRTLWSSIRPRQHRHPSGRIPPLAAAQRRLPVREAGLVAAKGQALAKGPAQVPVQALEAEVEVVPEAASGAALVRVPARGGSHRRKPTCC
ncbi:hypothetical protein BH20GEM3_BH20GEM3_15880 [soil metagenome]